MFCSAKIHHQVVWGIARPRKEGADILQIYIYIYLSYYPVVFRAQQSEFEYYHVPGRFDGEPYPAGSSSSSQCLPRSRIATPRRAEKGRLHMAADGQPSGFKLQLSQATPQTVHPTESKWTLGEAGVYHIICAFKTSQLYKQLYRLYCKATR